MQSVALCQEDVQHSCYAYVHAKCETLHPARGCVLVFLPVRAPQMLALLARLVTSRLVSAFGVLFSFFLLSRSRALA